MGSGDETNQRPYAQDANVTETKNVQVPHEVSCHWLVSFKNLFVVTSEVELRWYDMQGCCDHMWSEYVCVVQEGHWQEETGTHEEWAEREEKSSTTDHWKHSKAQLEYQYNLSTTDVGVRVLIGYKFYFVNIVYVQCHGCWQKN